MTWSRRKAEHVRAANHATINWRAEVPAPGLVYASDIYDVVGGLRTLVSRLPQLCDQLAEILRAADRHGTLTGPVPERVLTAMELVQLREPLETAVEGLNIAFQRLAQVGGFLSLTAETHANEEG